MVYIRSILGLTLLASYACALPMPDSAIGEEVGVSAPNGTPITDTVELASQTAAEASATIMAGEPPAQPTESPQPSKESPQEPSKESPPSNQYTPPSKSYPMYGSGSSSWSNGDQYNDCVNKCMATYSKPSVWSPTTTSESTATEKPSGTEKASGATHTVIVAPTQGVLRYVPFAVNASVGDTILFKWNANNHTVTKSSQLTPCNKTGDAAFATGVQIKDFEFTQVVNSTEPTFFFCGVPNHCQKGMFGVINPPNAFGAPSSVAGQWNTLIQSNTDLAAMSAWTRNTTAGQPGAASWGRSIDLAQMPDWSHPLVLENVMYTQTFLAENPETMSEDGGVSLASASTTPLKFPEDLSVALSNASGDGYGQPSTPAASASVLSAAPEATPESALKNVAATNGAMSSMSPSLTLGLITVIVTFFML